MKKHIFAVFMFVAFIMAGRQAQAQWVEVKSGLVGLEVGSFAAIDNYFFAGTEGSSGIFRSSDSGANWAAINNGLTSKDVFCLLAVNHNIFAGTWGGGGVFRSTNYGTSWTDVKNGLNGYVVNSLDTCGGNLFAGEADGVFISSNNGSSWTDAKNGLPPALNSWYLSSFNGNLFAGTYSGIYISSDNGSNWNVINNGLPDNCNVHSLLDASGNLFAGTSNGIFLSTDNGGNWSAVDNGLPDSCWIDALLSVKDVMFVGAMRSAGNNSGGVYFSTNNGASWTAISNDSMTYPSVLTLANIGGYLFAGTVGGAYRRPLSDFTGPVLSVAIDSITFNLSTSPSNSDTALIKNSGTGTLVIDSVVSTDSAITVTYPDSLAAGDSANIIVSINAAANKDSIAYLIITTNDPLHPVYTIMMLIKGQASAVFEDEPVSFQLSQAHPNPFSSSTIIAYSLAQSSPVMLNVYNSLGAEVATLARGVQSAGAHSVSFSGANLPEGMYFYRLSVDKSVQMGTMTVVR